MEYSKMFSKLLFEEKAYLLHVWFPIDIRKLLRFIQETLDDLLLRKFHIKLYWDEKNITADKWLELLEILKEHIKTNITELQTNPFTFLDHFSKGYCRKLFLVCLRQFLSKSKNKLFTTAARLFFFNDELH